MVAGAPQDHDRALIVRERSFGKGLVQVPHRLGSGGYVVLTVARYYTPSRRLVQRTSDGMSLEAYRAAKGTAPEDAPAFATRRGRTVYGGGGIAPGVDVEIPTLADDPETVWAAARAYAREVPDDARLADFLEGALSAEARASLGDGDLDPATEALLKQVVAEARWDEEGARRTLLRTDPVVVEALKVLAAPPSWLR